MLTIFRPQKSISNRYVFTHGGMTISWRLIKQTTETCGLPFIKDNVTKLYEDNVACIAQIKKVCIKGDKIKHILSKFFYIHQH